MINVSVKFDSKSFEKELLKEVKEKSLKEAKSRCKKKLSVNEFNQLKFTVDNKCSQVSIEGPDEIISKLK